MKIVALLAIIKAKKAKAKSTIEDLGGKAALIEQKKEKVE